MSTIREVVGVRGVLEIRTEDGRQVRALNALVGPHILAKLAGAPSITAETITRLWADDDIDVSVLAPTILNGGITHSGTDEFVVFQWVLGAGVGTGIWDDVYIGTATLDVLSEFLGIAADLDAGGIPNGEKLAGATWFVTYTLYFVQGALAS